LSSPSLVLALLSFLAFLILKRVPDMALYRGGSSEGSAVASGSAVSGLASISHITQSMMGQTGIELIPQRQPRFSLQEMMEPSGNMLLLLELIQ